MSRHLEHALDQLKGSLLDVGQLVEQNVAHAIQAVETRDPGLAVDVIVNDTEIDKRDIAIEEECLHILALYQPVASDMRFVATVLTINKDLERIGDLSVNLAEQAIMLSKLPDLAGNGYTFTEECERVLSMVHDSIDALVERSAARARTVLDREPGVNELHRAMYDQIKEAIRINPEDVERQIIVLLASRHLERIADHAVNIAEDVIYMAEGAIVRHNHLKPDAHRRLQTPGKDD